MQKVFGIISAPSPVSKCREELVNAVIELTHYQVLIIPPEPESDESGMRGTQGVTGQLKPLLLDISKRNGLVIELMRAAGVNEPTYNNVWDAVLLRYWCFYLLSQTLNACRVALDDYNPNPGRDWYKPFYHAMCVCAEDTYRWDLGLKSAIPNDALTTLAYSTVANFVIAGHRNPDLAWKEACSGLIKGGDLRPPF
jgi:hypothetical protein